jgi:hypothetical protein
VLKAWTFALDWLQTGLGGGARFKKNYHDGLRWTRRVTCSQEIRIYFPFDTYYPGGVGPWVYNHMFISTTFCFAVVLATGYRALSVFFVSYALSKAACMADK